MKKKLCWNCEGGVSLTGENCPYCGVYLHPGTLSQQEERVSLFSPPYPQEEESTETPEAQEEAPPITATLTEEEDWRGVLMTWLFLVSGLIFSLFGLVILLFSEQGVFSLRWDQENWWLFLLAGVPLLFFGWRSLSRL